ncbi:zinc finger protein with KRAB and SCAN domains 7 [Drosophila grimshawi]|uniref:GH24059 n=1 Tax=Drosophila grimshawi TaxID=7222 RepID=B4JNZ1_DROGR|nr:zinc finger protein with KRAB and SCAN domains 7 [Drosophila grimshawi]EDV92434.1 GH24059 [Drosophila grimshawi]
MNSKRVKYTTLSTQTDAPSTKKIVPVILHHDDEVESTQYTYAYTTNEDDDTETAVVTLTDREHEALANAQEVIIDENGHAVTLQQLVENSTVEEVETIDQGDGTHTILRIVPNMADDDDEGDEGDEDDEDDDDDDGDGDGDGDGEAIDEYDDDIVGAEHDEAELEEENEMGSIVFEGTIDNSPESDSQLHNKAFYCPNCGNCYSAAGSLKLHMRACLRQRNEVSAEDRKCKVCTKVFNSVAYLKEHMMRHTGEQPYRCIRCYRKFVDESKYDRHMDSHKHQDKLEAEAEALAAQHGGKKVIVKEFTCSFCTVSFTVVFDVGQVKRRYACDACRDKYSNAEALRQHKQQLEKKREYSCERCGRKFVFEGFLQRHLPTCDGSIKRRRDMK